MGVKAKWVERNMLLSWKASYTSRRGVCGYADWAWVRNYLKAARKKRPNSEYLQGIKLYIEVVVWPEHDRPSCRKLSKKFGEAELRAAKAYAKETVETGQSVMSEVSGVWSEPFTGNKTVVIWGEYEPADP